MGEVAGRLGRALGEGASGVFGREYGSYEAKAGRGGRERVGEGGKGGGGDNDVDGGGESLWTVVLEV